MATVARRLHEVITGVISVTTHVWFGPSRNLVLKNAVALVISTISSFVIVENSFRLDSPAIGACLSNSTV